MTILEDALKGIKTDEMIQLSKEEKIDVNKIMNGIAKGQVVIMKHVNFKSLGIGFLFKTKINVNIGTSSCNTGINDEIEKVRIAQKYGANTISDLSMDGNLDLIRKLIIKNSTVPITTVPIYQAIIESNSLTDISDDLIFKVIEKQIKDGISSIVLHAGFSLDNLKKLKGKRIMALVSKGGSLTAAIMSKNSIENPFFKNFEYILEMVKEKDVVINLGNTMRSGCIHDKIDEFQISEMLINSKLAKKANEKGIQVILESLGGHINVRDLIDWIKIHKKLTENRPLFVSGPLPIEIAVGYDHIAAAIGGAFASGFGADYLCAITPAEHLSLPTGTDIKNGLIACKIAAHVGDSMKFGLNHLFNDDLKLSKNRFLKNWKKQFELCLDPEEPQRRHPINQDICTMCGKYCALSISKDILKIFRN
ncbi:MAG: phosphomethylpyrimidine synthase ThiC [Candidatus Helarchaeota archaeon]